MVIDYCITINYVGGLSIGEKKSLAGSSINGEHGGSGNFEAMLMQKNDASLLAEPRLKNSVVLAKFAKNRRIRFTHN
jgi:hypothetical protein